MALDPVTLTALESLVRDALPDIQRRFDSLLKEGAAPEELNSLRLLLANTLDLLAVVGVWMSDRADGDSVESIPRYEDTLTSTSTKEQIPPRAISAPVLNLMELSTMRDGFSVPTSVMDGLSDFGDLLEADQLRLHAVNRVIREGFPEAPFLHQLNEIADQLGRDVSGIRRMMSQVIFRDSTELDSKLAQGLLKVQRESGMNVSVERSFAEFKVDHAQIDSLAEALSGAAVAMGIAASAGGDANPAIRIVGAQNGGVLQFKFSFLRDAFGDALRSIDVAAFNELFDSLKAIVYLNSVGQECLVVEMPASLKSMKGIVVQSAGEVYALPVHGIIETIRIDSNKVQNISGQDYLNFRSSSLPLISLAEILGRADGFESDDSNPSMSGQTTTFRYALVVQSGGRRFGLTVDKLLQHRELAVRPLGGSLAKRRAVMGGAIDSDGRVILVLDPRQVRPVAEKNVA